MKTYPRAFPRAILVLFVWIGHFGKCPWDLNPIWKDCREGISVRQASGEKAVLRSFQVKRLEEPRAEISPRIAGKFPERAVEPDKLDEPS